MTKEHLSGMGGALIPNDSGNGMKVSDADTAKWDTWRETNRSPDCGSVVFARGQRWLVIKAESTPLHGPHWQLTVVPVDRAVYCNTMISSNEIV